MHTDVSQFVWRRLNGDPITSSLRSKIEQTIIEETEKGHKLKVCIGTDSQVKGKDVEFASVIVFLREKKGGFMFVHKGKFRSDMSLKERMIEEVGVSVQVAYNICDLLDTYDVELEVHADINTDTHFASNVALRDPMGYLLGMGFIVKPMPEAFASSYCAGQLQERIE